MSDLKPHHRPPWIIRTYAGFGSAEDSNKRFHENLKNGQTGLSIAFDLPTQNGYDPDAPMARGEVGGCGVSIAHLGDMETLMHGIDLGIVNTSMTINATAPFLLALYLLVAEKQHVPKDRLHGTVQNDLLKEFVARGTSIFTPGVSLRLSKDVITFSAEHIPHWNPINVCGYHYTESGALPEEEIGYAFGNAFIILDGIRGRLSPEHFASVVQRISFFINSGIDLVPEICKARVYAQLWPELCKEVYGIEDIRFRAGCQVQSLSLPASQPENNIARIVLEALPVLLSSTARVNALQLPGFREALALPDAMEQTLSLRIQQILMHESRITEYGDIFEGNPIIQSKSDEMRMKARRIAFGIREQGYEQAIESIYQNLTKRMYELKHRIETKEDIVVGVNQYTEPVGLSEQLAPAPVTLQDRAFEDTRVAAIKKWRKKRDIIKLRVAQEMLQAAASNGMNIMEPTIEFARAGGTVGEWTSTIELNTNGRHTLHLDLQAVGTNGSIESTNKNIRIVLGKAGLDGHTNAIKLLALACRNAGMEVIFTGIKQSPSALMKAAVEEDADVLALSCLSGAHLRIGEELVGLRAKLKFSGLKMVMGGTIPENDKKTLLRMGFDLVVNDQRTAMQEIIDSIAALPAR